MSTYSHAHVLASRGIANLGTAFGQRLRVLKGTAWITQGDARDLILEAGEQAVLDGRGTALVTALTGSIVFEVETTRQTALAA